MLRIQNIRAALAGHQRVTMPPGPVPAAVLLPLFQREGNWHVLFTKRTEQLNHHGGEISFPGGVCQPKEAPLQAALRETWEEVGIPPDEVDILGALDDAYSIHNYLVTPFVGVFPGSCRLTPNREEIDRLIEIPLRHLLLRDTYRCENWTWQGRQHPVDFYSYNGDEVWGLTAAILKQFLDLIFPTFPSGSPTGETSIPSTGKSEEGSCLTAS